MRAIEAGELKLEDPREAALGSERTLASHPWLCLPCVRLCACPVLCVLCVCVCCGCVRAALSACDVC